MIYYEYSILFIIINSIKKYSSISLFYIEKKINVKNFRSELYIYLNKLKCIFKNSFLMMKYFHNLITIIIEMILKEGIFDELNHYYEMIEYQERYISHIHMTILFSLINFHNWLFSTINQRYWNFTRNERKDKNRFIISRTSFKLHHFYIQWIYVRELDIL